MIQIILNIFYWVGIVSAVICCAIGLSIVWHMALFGGDISFNKEGKGKDFEIKIILYNYTKYFKNEPNRETKGEI